MKTIEPKEFADKVIGQTIVGLEINFDDGSLTIQLSGYDIDIFGDDMELHIFDVPKPN